MYIIIKYVSLFLNRQTLTILEYNTHTGNGLDPPPTAFIEHLIEITNKYSMSLKIGYNGDRPLRIEYIHCHTVSC